MDSIKSLFLKKGMSPLYNPLYNPSSNYLRFRGMSLNLNKRVVGLNDVNGVFGVILEYGADDGSSCHSLVVGVGRPVALYYSNGGGIISAWGVGGAIPRLSNELISCCLSCEPWLTKRSDYPLPSPAMVRAYVIRKDMVLTSEFAQNGGADGGDDGGEVPIKSLSFLFGKAQELISALKSG